MHAKNKNYETFQGLTFDYSYQSIDSRPLYHRYERQSSPQPAYLELSSDGEVSVGYNPEIGNAVPSRIWHKIALRWTIPCDLSVADIDAMLSDTDVLNHLAYIHAHHEEVWNGSNHVGVLSEEAEERSWELEKWLADWHVSDMADEELERYGLLED